MTSKPDTWNSPEARKRAVAALARLAKENQKHIVGEGNMDDMIEVAINVLTFIMSIHPLSVPAAKCTSGKDPNHAFGRAQWDALSEEDRYFFFCCAFSGAARGCFGRMYPDADAPDGR
ncbi:MAG: hypothetical protein AAGI12_15480 [Pseudomonadota bacterium]